MIKKLYYCLFFFFIFFISNSAFALVQNDYSFINDYNLAYERVSNDTNTIMGYKIIDFIDYIDTYISNNKTSDIDYSIFSGSQDGGNTVYVYVALTKDSINCYPFIKFFLALESNPYYGAGFAHFNYPSGCGTGGKTLVIPFGSLSSLNSEYIQYLTDFITGNSVNLTSYYFRQQLGHYLPDISNSNFYLTTSDTRYFLPYKSTIPLHYDEFTSDTFYNRELFTVIFDDVSFDYNFGDIVPTYRDLSDLDDVVADNIYSKYISNYYGLFFSNIPVDKIYDYELNFSVAQNINYQDISYEYNLFGRINHGKYFTYEPISCNVGTSNSEPVYGGSGVGQSTYVYQTKTFGIIDCSSDLSKYDYIYINAYANNPTDLVYFAYNSNYGLVTLNDFISSPYKVVDYFEFDKNTNMFLSSNLYSVSAYYGSLDFNKFVTISYDLTTFENKKYFIANRYYDSYRYFERYDYIGQHTNTGIGFNLYSNYDSGTMYVLVDNDILVSYDSNFETNDTFYYYDSTGNIVNNKFNVYHSFDPDTNTSIDNYFKIVRDYIDSLSSDILSFSNVLQECYDLAPESIQNIIFVFYILIMSYLIFRLIGK